MEPEGSLPCSQAATTLSYPQPNASSPQAPYHPIFPWFLTYSFRYIGRSKESTQFRGPV
jgi:hypothetical protein